MTERVKGVPGVGSDPLRDEIAGLVGDARCGRPNAEETLLRRVREVLISYFVRSQRLESSLADDLAQRALIAIHRVIHREAKSVRPEAALGYVRTVAKRLANKNWRDPYTRRATEPLSLTSPELTDPQADPADRVARHDLVERALAAGRTHLSRESFDIVVRHVNGWSLADIAEELGCSSDTVRQRHSRAMRTLRKVLR